MSNPFVPPIRPPIKPIFPAKNSPSISAFLDVDPSNPGAEWFERFSGMSPSTQMETLGGSQGATDIAANQPSYVATRELSSQSGVPPREDTNAFLRLLDFIGRPSYAVQGFLSGAQGKPMYGYEGEETVAPGSYVETAMRRFGQGIRGENRYSFSDTTNTAKEISEGKPVSGFENLQNIGAGIVVDTIFDPLTYLSFGGTILGRVGGARIVKSRLATKLDDLAGAPGFDSRRFIEETITSSNRAASVRGIQARTLGMFKELSKQMILRADETARAANISAEAAVNIPQRRFANMLKSFTFDEADEVDRLFLEIDTFQTQIDDLLKKNPELLEETLGGFDIYRELARKIMPDTGAFWYHFRGASGLRRWAMRTFGEDAGKDFFRSLPIDIQGGVRIRAPFFRAEDGTPYATRLLPGAGEIGDWLAKRGINGWNNAFEVTQKGRDLLRLAGYSTPLIGKILANGRAGDVAYRSIIDASGARKTLTSNVVTRNLFNGSERARAREVVDYVDYGAIESSIWKNATKANRFNQAIQTRHVSSARMLQEGIKDVDDDVRTELLDYWFSLLSDRNKLKYELDQITKGKLDKNKELVALSAQGYASILDEMGNSVFDIVKDSQATFNFLENYLPRRLTVRQRLSEGRSRRLGRGGGTDTNNLKQRTNDVAEWGLIDGEAFPIRWKGPNVIGDDEVRRVWMTNPIEIMDQYIQATQKSLDDLRLAEILSFAGIWHTPAKQKFKEYNESILSENLVELLGIGDRPGILSTIRSNLRNGPHRLLDEVSVRGVSDSTVIGALGEFGDERIVRDFESFLTANVETGGAGLTWRQGEVGDLIRRTDYDGYTKDYTKELKDHYINQYDGTVLVEKNGKWHLYYKIDPQTGEVRRSGELIVDPARRSFDSPAQAFRDLAEDAQIKLQRNVLYNNQIVEKMQKLVSRVDELLDPSNTEFAKVHLGLYAAIETQLRNGDITLEEANRLKTVLAERAYETIITFGRGRGQIVGSEGVVLTGKERVTKVVGAAKTEEIRPTEKFLDWVERADLTTLARSTNPETASLFNRREIPVRNLVVQYLGDVYGPQETMRAMARMFQAIDDTSTPRILYEEIYLPFYGMIREMMTIWRGPGFVGRNILGGGWNNFNQGVTKEDHLASARILVAREKTKARMQTVHGEGLLDMNEAEMQDEMVSLFRKYLTESFGDTEGTFIENTKDVDAIVELWGVAYDAGVVGSSRSSRMYELYNRSVTQRGTAFDPTSPDMRKKVLGDFLSTEYSGDIERKEATKWLRMTSNPLWVGKPWVQHFMGPMAARSEDFLRMAAFLRGVKTMGLEPAESGLRGYGASLWVKATQFDYTDLSPFERDVLKNLMPFWTWTRNNIPLQVRALIHNPVYIAAASRVHESMVSLFAEDDEYIATPEFINNQLMTMLPPEATERMNAILPGSVPEDARIAFGLPWIDPVIDMSRWLKIPTKDSPSPINMRELTNNLNPILTAMYTLFGSVASGKDYALRNYTDDVPGWARVLNAGISNMPGFVETEQTAGILGEGAPTSTLKMNRNMRDAVVDLLPVIGLLERNVPGFGDDSQQSNWLARTISGVFGLPFATVKDRTVAAQMVRDRERAVAFLEREYGTDAEYRAKMIEEMLRAGAPLDFIRSIDIASLNSSDIDVARAKEAWRVYSQVNNLMVNEGYSWQEVSQFLQGYLKDSLSPEEIQKIFRETENFAKSDRALGKNNFQMGPATDVELQRLGLSQGDIKNLSQEQRREVMRQILIMRGYEPSYTSAADFLPEDFFESLIND